MTTTLEKNNRVSVRGIISEIRAVPSVDGTASVLCKIADYDCKLFGELANAMLSVQDEWIGRQIQAHGHWEIGLSVEFVIDALARSADQHRADSQTIISPVGVIDRYIVINFTSEALEQFEKVADLVHEALREIEGVVVEEITESSTAYSF